MNTEHLHLLVLSLNQEVIELLSSFRAIMRKNFETLDVDKIQERWYAYADGHVFNPSRLNITQVLQ